MKKFLLSSLPLMAAGSLACHADGLNTLTANLQGKSLMANMAQQFKEKKRTSPLVQLHGFNQAPRAAAAWNPTATMQAQAWGYLYDEDDNMWYYTQDIVNDGSLWGSYISSTTINIYDNTHKLAGTITIDVPDTIKVNQITPYGTITKKFFDLNNKTQEVLVEMHQVGDATNNYQGTYHTRAYHLDGTLATEFIGSGVFVNIAKNSWTKYQRLVVSNSALEAVEGKTYSDGSQYYQTNDHIDIYKPVGWGQDTPAIEHSFTVNEDLTYYGSDGAPLNIYQVDGQAYYVLAHYAKIWDSGEYSENGDPIPTANNSLVIRTYNDKMTLVDSLNVPVEKSEDTEFPMASLGDFSSTKTVSKNYFTNDGNFAYVVTFFDYITSHDDFRYKFVAYDHEGNKLGTVCDNVYSTWFDMASVKGTEDQMVFLQYTTDETEQQMKVVDLPSMKQAAIIPAELDGIATSTVINRYGSADNYKYLMKVRTGATDANNNVLARIAWFNKDWSFDHYTEFNLGQNAENFALTLSDTYMTPYLFNTDDKLEFFYQAKMKEENSDKIDNVYVIADEDGKTLQTFTNSDELGTITTAGCFNATADEKELYLQYTDSITGKYNLEFFKLPVSKFTAGGDGTATNPYLIATAGDLAAVGKEPAASYKIVNDINMDKFNNANSTWKPIANFSGTLDGNNHYIANLHLNTTEGNVGLFGELGEKARIENVIITNPTVELASQNSTVGVLAASAVSDTITNVHVYDAAIYGDENDGAQIGGIIGQAALYTGLTSVSFNNGTIDAPAASTVGGIAGDIRTTSTISAAAVNDITVNAQSTVGGIVGSAMNSQVNDSHANGELNASHTVGGILGSNTTTTVERCIFNGKASVKEASWSGLAAAGIVGALDSDWTGSTKPIIKNNIAGGEIALASTAENDNTLHRIIGRSAANEGDTTVVEQRLADNLALTSMTIAGKTVTSADGGSVEGRDASESDITKETLTSMGYAFGNNAAEPWKESETVMPALYFENEAKAIVLSQSAATMKIEQELKLQATAYGTSAGAMDFSSSNEDVAEIIASDVDSKRADLTIKAKASGKADIIITLGNISAVCNVTVAETSAISETTVKDGGKLFIMPGNGCITADGATQICAFSTDGCVVAKANGQTMSTAKMGKGMFIVVATDAKGNKTAAKVVLK